MHELSLAQELIEQVCLAAARENALRATRLVVVIGPYSGIERDAFEFAFPMAAENTLAEGAELVIEAEPALAVCSQCGNAFPPRPFQLQCNRCGSEEIELKGGREFLLRSIDLEIP